MASVRMTGFRSLRAVQVRLATAGAAPATLHRSPYLLKSPLLDLANAFAGNTVFRSYFLRCNAVGPRMGSPTGTGCPSRWSIPSGVRRKADAAANAVQTARAKRNEPARSASIPTIGPARRRVTIAAASTMPISSGLRPLVSKNLGQNGDATPKAAYNAA